MDKNKLQLQLTPIAFQIIVSNIQVHSAVCLANLENLVTIALLQTSVQFDQTYQVNLIIQRLRSILGICLTNVIIDLDQQFKSNVERKQLDRRES